MLLLSLYVSGNYSVYYSVYVSYILYILIYSVYVYRVVVHSICMYCMQLLYICIMLTIGSSPNHHPALCDSVGAIVENARGYYSDNKSNGAQHACIRATSVQFSLSVHVYTCKPECNLVQVARCSLWKDYKSYISMIRKYMYMSHLSRGF